MPLNSIKESNKGKHVLNKLFYKHSIKTFTLQKLAKGRIKIPNTDLNKYRKPWFKNNKRVEGIKKNKKIKKTKESNEHNTYLRYFDNSDVDGFIYLIEPTNWSYSKLTNFIEDINYGILKINVNKGGESKSSNEIEKPGEKEATL